MNVGATLFEKGEFKEKRNLTQTVFGRISGRRIVKKL